MLIPTDYLPHSQVTLSYLPPTLTKSGRVSNCVARHRFSLSWLAARGSRMTPLRMTPRCDERSPASGAAARLLALLALLTACRAAVASSTVDCKVEHYNATIGRGSPQLHRALDQLQRVAEANWPAGAKDRNGRADPIFGSERFNFEAVRYYSASAKNLAATSTAPTICEVGFNWGATALMFLHAAPAARVVSFDLGERLYTNASEQHLLSSYGGRLQLIRGDSRLTIPAYAAKHPSAACDLVLVDGDHSLAGESANLQNFRRLARCKGSLYIMDDCNCARPGIETTVAWFRALKEGALKSTYMHATTNIPRMSQGITRQGKTHSFCAGLLMPKRADCAQET
jgi:hypothetical protein